MVFFKCVLCLIFACASATELMYEAFHLKRCRSPDNDIGVCVILSNCPYLDKLNSLHEHDADVIRFKKLAQTNCGNKMVHDETLVCCSRPIINTSVPTISNDSVSLAERTSSVDVSKKGSTQTVQDLPRIPLVSTPMPSESTTLSSTSPSTPVSLEDFPTSIPLKTSSLPTEAPPLLIETSSHPSETALPPLEVLPTLTSLTTLSLETSSLSVSPLKTALPPLEVLPTSTSLPTLPLETSSQPVAQRFSQVTTTEATILTETEDGRCTDPTGKAGYCLSLMLCPPLLSRLLAKPYDEAFKQLLRFSNAICKANPPVICCPDDEKPVQAIPTKTTSQTKIEPKVTLLAPEQGCGVFNLEPGRLLGKSPAPLGSWPWLALLGYKDGNDIKLACGGSLITSRHVLTAAHCVKDNLVIVRLGEYDLDKTIEAKHLDIAIAKISKHPEYDGDQNDISVLHLSKNVGFTDKIRPACIPDRIKFESKSLAGFHPFVAGWRKSSGEVLNVLQEMQLTIYENKMCEGRFLTPKQNPLDERIICAGELSSSNDTCYGDSGGPLMLPDALDKDHLFFDVIGVESYVRKCGDGPIPGVYTNVIFYSGWIREKISEDI